MFNIHREEIKWGGKTLVLETGQVARQADGAVVATYGGTSVLCTVVAAKTAAPDASFFPLTVHYQEKAFAAGKIPGGYFKREGRPAESETLVSRLIDRPLRPLFPDSFRNETQVICTVLSHDLENDADIVALIGASAAISISGIPFQGPVAGARVGYKDGNFILNPTLGEMETSDLDLVVAGTKDGVLMVESEAQQLSEEVMLNAVTHAHESMQDVIKAISSLAKKVGAKAWELPAPLVDKDALGKEVAKLAEKDLEKAYQEKDKTARKDALGKVYEAVTEKLVTDEMPELFVREAIDSLAKKIVRHDILEKGARIDGRDTKTVRQINCTPGFLPRAHGSALFTRGETQALAVMTLGTGQDEQIIDALTGEYRQSFMLHYNFPPFSVGEAGRLGSTSRREIGHGKLAWRAIKPVLPSKEEFPYTIRIVSDITESNGSSSMATVCGGILSLMDGGVPIKNPVAGIAMGLIKEGDKYSILSDILGDEDHLGDMDFKVAGSEEGITSLQMDIKITSITKEIMEKALEQAREGRLHILGEMKKGLSGVRETLKDSAPRIETIKINPDKIREVIGSGGKVIREICETSGAKVDIDDTGTIKVAGTSAESIEKALEMINNIVAEPEIGQIYVGKVVKVVDFGAFVNFLNNQSGLVHISEMTDKRGADASDFVSADQEVKVKVIGIDDRGKIRLSMKQATSGDNKDNAADA